MHCNQLYFFLPNDMYLLSINDFVLILFVRESIGVKMTFMYLKKTLEFNMPADKLSSVHKIDLK